ncbi:carboxypeptidase regulatory-like domain-containing protein [Granulicella sp. 5B5]|uniref:TonB-dependent receptor n=1 Tax=Granulicella sp. 5B5 TaxID=1617967 RepID=UPI0017734194|nr:carboxypeptidase-like regulatory domain-containing protein [Granulicella sp. 5B5]QMV18759.1 carboxypeptidase regulatory-like domain-containing protein [Granulicella sp. 5B5]
MYGQVAGTGNIQGTISDPTGAVIPGAQVTLTDNATQIKRNIVSDSGGVYAFPNIPIGTYTLSVMMQGFKTFQRNNVVLEVGSSIAVNASMQIGATDQKIEVTTTSLALQTEDPTFKQTIDRQTVTEMPLNGRHMTDLITLAGGAAPAPAGDFTGSKYSYATISVSIAGGAGNTTMWRLDGGDNNDYMSNGNLPFPFPDAVAEFSVESTVLGAQSGMHSGGLVNVVTNQGTNKYHGSAFEFLRNDYINAIPFYVTNGQKDGLHQNQYGGTFGGPILKDKLFAFAGYQHQRTTVSSNATGFVPTAANLLGDYSVTDPVTAGDACTTKTVQLYDPVSGALIPGNKYATTPTYNPQALALYKYLPVPNAATDPNNCGAVSYYIPTVTTDNEFDTRVDYTINGRNHFYARYFIDGYQVPAPYQASNILVTTQSGNIQRTQSYTMGEDFTISSRTVNSAHTTLTRRVNVRGYSPSDINAATLGVNVFQGESYGLYLVAASKFTIGGGTNSVSHFNDNSLSFSDDVNLVRGNHQIVLGGEFVRNQLNIGNQYESNGVFEFGGTASSSAAPGTTSTVGDADLDFLMGQMTASGQTPPFQQSKQQQNALRAPIPSLYAQDTWHATKRLTAVAGIRWAPEYFPVDYFGRGSEFNMNAFVANQFSTVYPTAPAGSFYYGDTGVAKSLAHNTPWQFSPNVGFSYDLKGDGRTVVRGGAELIYDEVNFFTGQRTQQNPPFATAITQTQTATSGPIPFSAPWSVGAVTSNPFPLPFLPTGSQAIFFSQSQFVVISPQFKAPYTMQWTASVQHQFPHGWEMQLDYIGNKTTHAPEGLPLSPAIYTPGVWGAGGTGCGPVVLTGPAGAAGAGKPGTACSTTGNQRQRFYLTEQNPAQGDGYQGGGGGSNAVTSTAMSNYNGMVATVQHRLSSDFSLLANWTWSKCLNIVDASGDYAGTSVENPYNPGMDYGPCGSDYRHIENIVLVTESHFHISNDVVRYLANGWEFSPLTHITSGAPVNVTAGVDNSLTDIGNDRPNRVPGVPVYIRHQLYKSSGVANRQYLNPAAFAQVCPTGATPLTCAAYGTYGNISRNAFRGLPQYQFDANLTRNFPITKHNIILKLRLDAFNVLNHPNFTTPTASLSSSTFGQISGTSATPVGNSRIFQGAVKLSF